MPGLVWILSALLAIANLGDWEAAGLAIAVLGGIAVACAAMLELGTSRQPIPPPHTIPSATLSPYGSSNAVQRWVAEHELWILLVAGPLFLIPRNVFVLVFVLIPILWVFRWRVQGYLTQRTPLDWPILLILLMLSVSMLVSANVDTSFPRFTGILFSVAVFYAIVNWVHSERELGWIAVVIVMMGVVVGGLGLFGTRWFTSGKFLPAQVFSLLPHFARFPGATNDLFDPNQVGGTLALGVPFLAVLAVARWNDRTNGMRGERLGRFKSFFAGRGLAIPLTFTGVVLVLTQSRSALFGVAVAIAAFVAIRWRRTRWVLAGLALIAILLAAAHDLNAVAGILIGNGGSGVVGELDFAGREELWSRALYAIQDFPFTGVGLNMFGQVVTVLYPLFLTSPDTIIYHAHDMYLQVAVDLGIPGLVAYLALLSAFGYCVLSVYQSNTGQFHRQLALALGMGVLAHQVFGFTDAVILGAKQGIILWVMLALGAGLWSLDRSQKDE